MVLNSSSSLGKSADLFLSNFTASNDKSPIFPPIDKNLLELILKEHTFKHCLYDSPTLTCYMELAEDDIIYMPKVLNNAGARRLSTDQKPPVLRGHIVLKIKKPTRLKQISLTLNGRLHLNFSKQSIDALNDPEFTSKCVTECDLLNHSWPFYKETDNIGSNKNCDVYYTLQEINDLREHLKQEEGEENNYFDEMKHQSLVRKRATSIASDRINDIDFISNPDLEEHTNPLKQISSPTGSILGAIKTFLTATPSQSNNGLFPSTSEHSIEADDERRPRSATIRSQDSKSYQLASIKSNGSTVLSHSNSHEIFETGFYVYSFEYLIPLIFPETVKTDMATIIYRLKFFVERAGAFKSNIDCSRELNLIRIPDIDSVEESEPISVSKEWDNALKYEILISSKDVILNAFLPIKINLTPIQKCSVHRIRVYITETIELTAYANGASKYDPVTGKKKKKKLTTEAPQKKFLICEYKAPPLKDLRPDDSRGKAKNLGNLLCEDPSDPKHSFLSYQDFPLQIYIPEFVSNSYKLSPNISTNNIKIAHSLKINLRLSKNNQHFEISIDTPIIVQHKLSTHTTTLLPPYDRKPVEGESHSSSNPHQGTHEIENYYYKNATNMLSANIYNQPEAQEDDVRLKSPQAVPLHSNVKLPDFEDILTLNSPAISSDVSLAAAEEWPNIEDVLFSPETNGYYMSDVDYMSSLHIASHSLNQVSEQEDVSMALDGMVGYKAVMPPSYDEFLATQNVGPLSPKINPEIFGTNEYDDVYISKDLDEFDMVDLSDSEDDLGGGYLENRENPFL